MAAAQVYLIAAGCRVFAGVLAAIALALSTALAQGAYVDPLRTTQVSVAPKVFELSVSNGKASGSNGTLRVTQGDNVELRWSSDRPMRLHLHGYDIETEVSPQAPAVMSFRANIAGRFSIEEHAQGPGHKPAILYLEVYP